MDEQSLFVSIAKFAVLKENDVVADTFFLDEALEQNSDELDVFVKTVSHFVSLYKAEFIDAFNFHCKAEISEEQFLNFVKRGINALGGLEGNLGFLLPCAFVGEFVYLLKKNFCKKFLSPTRICLEQFLQNKFEGSEPNSIWKQLLDYCVDMNTKLCHLESSSESESSSDDQSRDAQSGLTVQEIYAEKRRVLINDKELDNNIAARIATM